MTGTPHLATSMHPAALLGPGRSPARWGVVTALGYLAWLVTGRPGADALPHLGDLVWTLLAASAAAGCWQLLRRDDLPPRITRTWRLAAMGMALLVVSLLLHGVLAAAGAHTAGTVVELLGLLHLPFVVAALVAAPTEADGQLRDRAWAFDIVILVVSGLLLLWLVVVRSIEPPTSGGALALVSAYGFPIADFVTLYCVAAVWLRRPARIMIPPLLLLTVAVGATLLGDIHYAQRATDAMPAAPLFTELTWLLGATAALLTPAAQLAAIARFPEPRSAAARAVPSISPFVLATGVAISLLIKEGHWHELPGLIAAVGIITVLGLVAARQWVAQRGHAAALDAQAQLDARYSALVEGSTDIVAVTAPDGVLRFCSPSVEKVLGYRVEEVLGVPMVDFVHPDERSAFVELFAGVVAGSPLDATPPSTWRLHARDERIVHRQATAVNRSQDPAINGVILNGRDVSTQVNLEQRLRQARQMEAIGRFASVIAHDFNHVLSAIKLNVQLQRDLPDDPAAAAEILSAVELGSSLTRQLMAVSQHRATAPVVLDLAALLREAEPTTRMLVGNACTLALTAPASAVPVQADAAQLRQVVMNLVINARDAAPGGRIDVALTTRTLTMADARALVGLKPGPHASLTVTDDGAGLPPEVLQRLFEPFYTTKSGGRGTGLGLTIVYGIVTGVGGVIHASNVAEHGARFEVLLPLADTTTTAPVPALPTAVPAGRPCVLIVDDDPAIRYALQRAFSLRGYTALLAEDGVAALDVLREHGSEVHLVLTDMRMPRLDGPGLIEALSQSWPTVPVLGMSGFLHADDHARLAPHVRRLIEKPFTLDEVLRAVDEALT